MQAAAGSAVQALTGGGSELFNSLKQELRQVLDGQTPASGRDFKTILQEMLNPQNGFDIKSFPKTMLKWAKSAGYGAMGKAFAKKALGSLDKVM